MAIVRPENWECQMLVEDWIDQALSGGNWFRPNPTTARTIESAFHVVLSHLSPDELSRFVHDLNPIVLHLAEPALHGAAFSFPVAPNPRPEARWMDVTVIFLESNLAQLSYEQVLFLIAHEIAHLMLGHHDVLSVEQAWKAQREREADGLAARWGFPRC